MGSGSWRDFGGAGEGHGRLAAEEALAREVELRAVEAELVREAREAQGELEELRQPEHELPAEVHGAPHADGDLPQEPGRGCGSFEGKYVSPKGRRA